MGLFRKRKKKTDNTESTAAALESLPKAYYEPDAEGRKQFVEAYCRQMSEAAAQLEESKREYAALTEKLADIQLIDEMEPERAAALQYAAGKIAELNIERMEAKKDNEKISQSDYFHMMTIEEDFYRIHDRMEEDEQYCQAVRKDMHYLEGEKGSLRFECEECEDSLDTLERFAGILAVMFGVSVAGLVFAVVGFAVDVTIVGSIIFLIAAVAGVAVLGLYKSRTYRLKTARKKLNKAITLLNGTKIRYVNITNSLDYQYMKHNVNSAYELERLFELYQEVRKERLRFQKASGALHEAEQELVELLSAEGLSDPQTWIYQTEALLDKREMVEVRHNLNAGRQKLRERIDYNSKAAEDAKKQIMEFARLNARYADEITQTVRMCDRTAAKRKPADI